MCLDVSLASHTLLSASEGEQVKPGGFKLRDPPSGTPFSGAPHTILVTAELSVLP